MLICLLITGFVLTTFEGEPEEGHKKFYSFI
jgi:hypothetical protein